MVIDLLEKNRVNIKDLVLPEAEKQAGFNFDPRRDLTPTDWKWIFSRFDEARKESKFKIPEDFLLLASNIKVIDPDKHPERLIREEEWGAIKNSVEGSRGLSDWSTFAHRAAVFKLLDKSRFEKIDIPIKDYLAINTELREAWSECTRRWSPENFSFFRFARDFRILAPVSPLPDENEKVWTNMMDRLDYYEDHNFWQDQNRCELVLELLATARMILPEKFSQLRIKKQTVDAVNNYYQSVYQDKETFGKADFTLLVVDLKILSAKDVQVTDQGLEITMPDQLVSDTTDLPAVRKF